MIALKRAISIEDENKARICLPDDDNPIDEEQECYAAGWGLLDYFGFSSDYLREVKVNRVTNKECNKFESYHGRIKNSQTCAGLKPGGKDACTHDSGGSLACKQKSKYCLIFVTLSVCLFIYNASPFSFSSECLFVLSLFISLIISLSINLPMYSSDYLMVNLLSDLCTCLSNELIV